MRWSITISKPLVTHDEKTRAFGIVSSHRSRSRPGPWSPAGSGLGLSTVPCDVPNLDLDWRGESTSRKHYDVTAYVVRRTDIVRSNDLFNGALNLRSVISLKLASVGYVRLIELAYGTAATTYFRRHMRARQVRERND